MKLSRSVKKHIRLLTYIALLLFIPVSVVVMTQEQNTQSKAAPASKLYFTPTSTSVNPLIKQVGNTFSIDLMVDPSTNVVSYVKFDLQYDASKLSVNSTSGLQVNSTAFPLTVEGPVLQSGRVAAGVGIGSDPTKGIIAVTKVATITFTVLENTTTPSEIRIKDNSQVLSLGTGDQYGENVLQSVQHSYIATSANQPTTPITPTVTGIVTPSTQLSPTQIVTTQTPTATTVPNATSTPIPTINVCNQTPPTYSMLFSSNQHVPPTTSSHTAIGTLKIPDPANKPLTYQAIINLNTIKQEDIISIKLHAPARVGATSNAIVTLTKSSEQRPGNYFTSEPFNVPPEVAFYLRDGQAYFTIYTTQLPNGEVRAQVTCGDPFVTPPPPASPTPMIPTPTMEAGGFRLILNLLFHGIGKAGDSPNPGAATFSNKNPVNQERPMNVTVVNSDNQVVAQKIVPAFYDVDNGRFFSHVDIPTSLPPDDYVIKVKPEGYLRKLMPGFFKIEPGKATTLPTTQIVAGDVNDDNVLNILDYNVLYDCGYGVLNPVPMINAKSLYNSQACKSHEQRRNADVNDDATINSKDYNLFIRELSVQVGE